LFHVRMCHVAYAMRQNVGKIWACAMCVCGKCHVHLSSCVQMWMRMCMCVCAGGMWHVACACSRGILWHIIMPHAHVACGVCAMCMCVCAMCGIWAFCARGCGMLHAPCACGKWRVGIMRHVLVWHALVWIHVYLLYAMWQNARVHVRMCMRRWHVAFCHNMRMRHAACVCAMCVRVPCVRAVCVCEGGMCACSMCVCGMCRVHVDAALCGMCTLCTSMRAQCLCFCVCTMWQIIASDVWLA
jgi:hypothetical protein